MTAEEKKVWVGYKFIKRNTDSGVLMELWQDDINHVKNKNSWKKVGNWVEKPGYKIVSNSEPIIATYVMPAKEYTEGTDIFSINEQMKDIE